jgi:hypothetical protein
VRWPWVRDREPTTATSASLEVRDEAGVNEAQRALDTALSRWPDVTRVAEDMRGIRRRNHLADKVHDALGGHAR